MEIVPIFAPCLYSTQISEEDEFSLLMDNMTDVYWLTKFFSKNSTDLNSGFYGNITIKEAVQYTLAEAEELEKQFLKMKTLNDHGHKTGINRFFKPLSNTQTTNTSLEKSKATGTRHKSWIRIYAIKLSEETFVITGGTIKLTQNMNNTKHTLEQLTSLTVCRDFLRSKDIFDSDSFFEFLTE